MLQAENSTGDLMGQITVQTAHQMHCLPSAAGDVCSCVCCIIHSVFRLGSYPQDILCICKHSKFKIVKVLSISEKESPTCIVSYLHI